MHTFLVSGTEETVTLKARCAAPSTLFPNERDRLQPLSPLLHCDTTQTDPACSTRDPANRAVGQHYGRATSSLKQDQHLPDVVSVPGKFPADPGDWKRPGVSMHERGPCISCGPGPMRQGASHRPMSRWRSVSDKVPG